MKCNVKNRVSDAEIEEIRERSERTNMMYLRHISRLVYVSLHENAGFGADRLRRVFSTPGWRYMVTIRMYLRGDNAAMHAEKQATLDAFNKMKIFPIEYNT